MINNLKILIKINKAKIKDNHRNHQISNKKVQQNRQVVLKKNRNIMIRIEKQ